MNLQGHIGVIAGALTPLVVWLFVTVARHQKPWEKKGAIVFPRNRAMRYFGFIGACICSWPIVLFAFGNGNDMNWWLAILFGFFAVLLASFCAGEVWLYDGRIEKRALAFRKRIPWDEVEALVQDRGEVLVVGTRARFKFDRYYAGSERLVSEIKKRAPKLQLMHDKALSSPPYPWANVK